MGLVLQGDAEYIGYTVLSTARQPLGLVMVMASLAGAGEPVNVGCATVLVVLLLKVAGEAGVVAFAGEDKGMPLYVTLVPLHVKLVA